MNRFACAAALLLTLTGPGLAEESPRRPFPLAGTLTFGLSYAVAFGFAVRFEEPELYVPVLGPIINLHRCRDCTGSAAEKGVIAGLLLDSTVQATGVALIVYELRRKPAPRRAELLPALVAGKPGLTIAGYF